MTKNFVTILALFFLITHSLAFSQDNQSKENTQTPPTNSKAKNSKNKNKNSPEDSSENSEDIKSDSRKISNEFNANNAADDEVTNSNYVSYAQIQALNKTTAKTSILDLKIGQRIAFGSLRIIAHKCWKSPLEQRPENKILLEIFESKTDDNTKTEKRIFYGWMFSSSPSISGIEHPIYDITALNCKY